MDTEPIFCYNIELLVIAINNQHGALFHNSFASHACNTISELTAPLPKFVHRLTLIPNASHAQNEPQPQVGCCHTDRHVHMNLSQGELCVSQVFFSRCLHFFKPHKGIGEERARLCFLFHKEMV